MGGLIMINKILSSKLLKDNLILLIGTNLAGFLAFLYHFYMGRVLGPEDYSVLVVVISFSYIMNVFILGIQAAVSKYVAIYKVRNSTEKINYLLRRSIFKLGIVGIVAIFIFIFFAKYVSGFLNMTVMPLYIVSFLILFSLILPLCRGVLQGLQDFKHLGINLAVEGIVKISLGVLFVWFGWKVNGATLAYVLGFGIPILFALFPLRNYLKKNDVKNIESKEIYKYALPMLIMLIALTAFFSIDVILVKHFFSGLDAGYYSALSILGKIIFFGCISISQVMFPKASEMHELKGKSKGLLYKSIGMIGLLIVPIILLYFLIPEFIIKIVYGVSYLPVAPLLGWFGLFMGLFSLVYLVSFYLMSINKTRFVIVLFLVDVLEVILIHYYHTSLTNIITILIGLTLFNLLFLGFNLWRNED